MLIGIFSDAHGDIIAMEKALRALQGADRLFYLGDVHDFVPTVKDCIYLLKSNGVAAVRGNCDTYAVIGDLSGEYRLWLEHLPMEQREGNMVFTHKPKDLRTAFLHEDSVFFCGHTHRSFLLTKAGEEQILPGTRVQLDRNTRYIIGIGSISRPRGGESKVVALFETDQYWLELIEL